MLFKSALNGLRVVLYMLVTVMFLLTVAGTGGGATKPTTVAEIALYQGPDREQILIDGAKKEGGVVFYNPNTWMDKVVTEDFAKKYPFIKVSTWRSDPPSVVKRLLEEYASGRFIADVIETTYTSAAILRVKDIFQEYYSPEAVNYGDEVKVVGKKGVYYLANREIYLGLGYNTKIVPPADIPRTYKDLLDPKWKGKMTLAGDDAGVRWVGHVINVMGRDYLEKMSSQELKVQFIAPVALLNQVISGEVPLTPDMHNSSVFAAKKTGAPVEWSPLEPVMASVGFSGVTIKAPHPYSALLLLDYLFSKEGQQAIMAGGLSSPRKDIGSLGQKFKKTYFEAQYTTEEYEKKFSEWEELLRRIFVKKM